MLLLLVSGDPGCGARPQVEAMMAEGALDWEAFISLAALQDVVSLLPYSPLWPMVAERLPEELAQHVKAHRLSVMMTNMAAAAELDRLESELISRGLSVIPLKGVALLKRLYPAMDARRCGDIDLLVRPRDRAAAYRTLESLGYRPLEDPKPGVAHHPFHGVPLVRTSGRASYVVELHWNLTDPRFVPVSVHALWERVERACASKDMLDLPTEELLVFLALHMPKHDTGLLRLLADVDRLVRREPVDWGRVEQIARSWRADILTFFALDRARALLGTPVPQNVLEALSPGRVRRVLVDGLSGVKWMLRPPRHYNLRANQFRMAYCLMLQPMGRAFRGYRTYIWGEEASSWMGQLSGSIRGVAWTVLIASNCLFKGKAV